MAESERSTRRTKKAYHDLYDHPAALFPGGPDNAGAEVILWPDGEPEIWIRSTDHKYGYRVVASHGPHGFGLRVSSFVGEASPTIRPEGNEVSMVQYHDTDKAQAFSRWYDHKETPADIALLGSGYARQPIAAEGV